MTFAPKHNNKDDNNNPSSGTNEATKDDDDFIQDITKYLDVLDENINILTDIEDDLDEQNEDELAVDVGLHDLIDMSHDVAKNAQLKKAERDLLRRQAQSTAENT